jgi:HD-GYP domain-containing protein (c-di-GMP phosphodiesterase class II)
MRELGQKNIKMPEKTYHALIQFAGALSAALLERDAYTRLHSDRVMNISVALGESAKLNAKELMLLKTASALHDIGKIGIPDEILLKPGNLNQVERKTMNSHCERGQNILLSIEHVGADVIGGVVRHHHEHFDGSGYPDGLAAEDIPFFSRIIAVADSYDAMATRRVYHNPMSHREIIDVMRRESGNKHDPYLFSKFIWLIETSSFRVA